MAEKLLLKKYANRRLYDTESSVYVTLAQVAEVIRAGREVEVRDAKSDEDVTAFILTQIILDAAKNRSLLLPVPFLHMIIRHGDNLLEEFFDKYLAQTIDNYLAGKAAFEEQFRQWLDMGANISQMVQKSMPGFPSFFGTGFPSPGEKKEDPPSK